MTKYMMIALTAVALPMFLSGQAYALTLINRTAVEQNVQISDGDSESVTRDVTLSADQTLDGICDEGCTIILENGVEEDFDGDEVIYIENGEFVIVQ